MAGARYQPQGRVVVNKRNPITKGLVHYYLGSGPLPATNQVQVPNPMGLGISYSSPSSAGPTFPSSAALPSTVSQSTVATTRFALAAFDGTDMCISQSRREKGDSFAHALQLKFKSTGQVSIVDTFTTTILDSTGVVLPNQMASIAMTCDSITPIDGTMSAAVWVNGVKTSGSSAQKSFYGGDPTIGGLGGNANAMSNGGSIVLHLSWSRVLSDSEIASLNSDPWQVFAYSNEEESAWDYVAPIMKQITFHRARYQPQGKVQHNRSWLASKMTANFALNGNFNSTLHPNIKSKPGSSSWPALMTGPMGYYAMGNASSVSNINTGILPSALGMSGSSPRTIVTEFILPDQNISRAIISFGDSSKANYTQFTILHTLSTYRQLTIAVYGNDYTFVPYTFEGTSARVFLAVTYDGNLTINVRVWSKMLSTGVVFPFSGSFTLSSQLATGNTVPLYLMGNGTYNFNCMNSALYRASFFGGVVLSDTQIEALYRDSYTAFDSNVFEQDDDLAARRSQNALYMNNQGYIAQRPGGSTATPLVLVNGEVHQRANSEGVPLVLDNGKVRTLGGDEDLLI